MISIEPILKSNYTSFMFNNIFCELTIKKVIPWGGGGEGGQGEWGNRHNFFSEV